MSRNSLYADNGDRVLPQTRRLRFSEVKSSQMLASSSTTRTS